MGIGYGEDLLVCAALGVDMVRQAVTSRLRTLMLAGIGGLRVSNADSGEQVFRHQQGL